ncbi:MAG: HepT-like ribonuclease domain-containing protein [Cyanobacteria bacterium J06638_20]
MLQSAELIMAYTEPCSEDEFLSNIQLQDAVIPQLLSIAEAARRASETTQQRLSQVSWQEINGMRNRLVHEYDAVNLSIVWNTIQIDVPGLIVNLKEHIPPEA